MKTLTIIGVVIMMLLIMLLGAAAIVTSQTNTRFNLIYSATATQRAKILDITYQGTTQSVILEIPNWTNNVTLVFEIYNAYGVPIYTSSSLARNQSVVIFIERLLIGDEELRFTLSGAPGGTGGTLYCTVVRR